MIILWVLLGYLLFNIFVWLLLFDEYDTVVRGWQQTNFTFHDRARLVVLLPGLPLVLLLALIASAREWRLYGRILSNFWDSTKDHFSIILTGSKLGYEKTE